MGAMKRLMALFCVLAVTAWADVPGFWSQLTPDERKAAGIDQLTPEQQAALDQLAQRYTHEGARKEVEAVKAQAQAETTEAVKKAREEAKAERSEAIKQAKEEAKAEAKAAARKSKLANAGLAARDDDEVIKTRILGKFTGWDGHTIFRLENGQVWQQSGPDLKYFPNLVDPEVELIPSSWAGWKLRIVSEGLWCKVRRVR